MILTDVMRQLGGGGCTDLGPVVAIMDARFQEEHSFGTEFAQAAYMGIEVRVCVSMQMQCSACVYACMHTLFRGPAHHVPHVCVWSVPVAYKIPGYHTFSTAGCEYFATNITCHFRHVTWHRNTELYWTPPHPPLLSLSPARPKYSCWFIHFVPRPLHPNWCP